MYCTFTDTGEVDPAKGRVFVCANVSTNSVKCGQKNFRKPGKCHCRSDRACELADVNCRHMIEITTGHTPACCNGEALIDVGVCSLGMRCTLGGLAIDGESTTDAIHCRFKITKG